MGQQSSPSSMLNQHQGNNNNNTTHPGGVSFGSGDGQSYEAGFASNGGNHAGGGMGAKLFSPNDGASNGTRSSMSGRYQLYYLGIL